MERFERVSDSKGVKKARWGYTRDVFRLFRPGIIKSFSLEQINYYDMFKTFLKLGWRNALKYPTHSFISVFGLSVGLCATLLLYLIISYDRSYDQFHTDSSDIYRVADQLPEGDVSDMIVTPLVPRLVEEYPEIDAGTRAYDWFDMFLYEDQGTYFSTLVVDGQFPDVFSFETIAGDLKKTLSTPGQMALTESIAQKVFGDEDPINKVLLMKDLEMTWTVTSVVADPPKNSSLQFESLGAWPASPSPLDEDQMGNWYNTFMVGFVKLAKGTNPKELSEKTSTFTQKYYLPQRKENQVTFLPYTQEHARLSENDRTINILAIIALGILVISCVNFANLSISRSISRVKEAGLRRVMGSPIKQVLFQFLVEGLIIIGIAMLLAIIGIYVFIPFVNDYFGFGISLTNFLNITPILMVMGLCVLIGVLSSTLVTLILSRTQPIKALKENVRWSFSGQWLQRGLLVFQFVVSLVFIAETMVIWKQITFMKHYDLKFDGNATVSIKANVDRFENKEKAKMGLLAMREVLPQETAIEAVSLSQNVPGKYWDNYNTFKDSDQSEDEGVHLKQVSVDHNFTEVLDIEIVQGRNFNYESASDQDAVLINESALKALGWTTLEGKVLRSGGQGNLHPVVGVVKDYHYRSLKESVEPMIHFFTKENTNKLLVELNPNYIAEGLALLEDQWATLNPYEPFSYEFIDQEFDALYKSQERLGTTSSLFSGIAVFLALLGLLAISSLVIKYRIKEIGVRKVLGASLHQIMILLSKRFIVLILLSILLASPFIYYLSKQFLDDFTYRISLSPEILVVASSSILLMAMALVMWQSGRAALANPVNTLRSE